MPFDRQAKILVVDDDEGVCEALRLILEDSCGRHQVTCARDGVTAVEIVRRETFDLAFLDLGLPGMDGFETLRRLKHHDADLDVLVVSGTDRAREAVEALRGGALEYVTKPFDSQRIMPLVDDILGRRFRAEEAARRASPKPGEGRRRIITQAESMRAVLSQVEKVAAADCSVLITGESGTGKELVAELVHARSPRGSGPFVAVNCAAIPGELLESELFGHEKGAFTGAYARRVGLFEQAHRGTLFLDEICSLRIDLQAKLLRVLQGQAFTRVGGSETVRVDARLVAASNASLTDLMRQGRFREDLYYRLSVIPIRLPPLRERQGDVALLAEHFLNRLCEKHGKTIPGLSPSVMAVLGQYPWPGNVRELRNFMERTVLLSDEGRPVDERDLPMDLLIPRVSPQTEQSAVHDEGLMRAREEFERSYILRCLELCAWNQAAAARLLRIHRNTLLKRMKALGITARE